MASSSRTSTTATASPILTILAPTDFSVCSLAGVRHAVKLARHLKARLLLLYVTEPVDIGSFLMPGESRPWHGKLKQRAVEAMSRLIVKEVPEDVKVNSYVRSGRPWQVIVDFAKRAHVDLIVLGTHGRTGVKHVLLGSVAERVVRHASCPVTTVR